MRIYCGYSQRTGQYSQRCIQEDAEGIAFYIWIPSSTNGWDVSNVQAFSEIFRGNQGFNEDISSWNTSKGHINESHVLWSRSFQPGYILLGYMSRVMNLSWMFVVMPHHSIKYFFNGILQMWQTCLICFKMPHRSIKTSLHGIHREWLIRLYPMWQTWGQLLCFIMSLHSFKIFQGGTCQLSKVCMVNMFDVWWGRILLSRMFLPGAMGGGMWLKFKLLEWG
jgi:Mycoplasma protein of unknown function, DUF285